MRDDQMTPAPSPGRSLVRSLRVMGVLFLTLSVATSASSVFVVVPGMLQVAGTGAVWATLIAGLVCVATAFVYAELSSAWPVAGGEYVAVAHTLGPMAGFAMLGVNVFNNLLFPPVAGLGVSAVLGTLVPGLPQIPIAVAVVAGSTLVAILQIRVNAWLTGLFLLVETLAIGAAVWLGFADSARPTGALLLHPVMPLVLSGAGLVAIYAGICVAAMVGRRSGKTAHAPYQMPLYPLAPVVTLLALGYVCWTSWFDLEEGRPGLIMTAAEILLSIGYYWFVLRRRGPWNVHTPRATERHA